MSRWTVGEMVVVIEDCRREMDSPATGQTGIYEGLFNRETGAADEYGNPRIRLQDGSVIWGYQCWWAPVREAGPLPQMQAKLEEHKAVLRAVLDIMTSPD